MTDDAKQAAWRRFCEQLEALGVNPHSPEVPEDDPRHEQVQAIVAEYRDIPLPLFPLPESWEGTPPLFTITSLDDVARWLCDEWSIVTATRMGSDDGFYPAKYRANQTIRNAHCHWALQNQPLMGASKPAEVWMFSKWSEAGFEDSQNCCESVF